MKKSKVMSFLMMFVLVVTSVAAPILNDTSAKAATIDLGKIQITGQSDWQDGEVFNPTYRIQSDNYASSKFDTAVAISDENDIQLYNSNVNSSATVKVSKSKTYYVYLWIYLSDSDYPGTISSMYLNENKVQDNSLDGYSLVNDATTIQVRQKLVYAPQTDTLQLSCMEELLLGDVTIDGPESWNVGDTFDCSAYTVKSSKVKKLSVFYRLTDKDTNTVVYDSDEPSKYSSFKFAKGTTYNWNIYIKLDNSDEYENYYWIRNYDSVKLNGRTVEAGIIEDGNCLRISKELKFTVATGKVSEKLDDLELGVVTVKGKTEYNSDEPVGGVYTATSSRGILLETSYRISNLAGKTIYDSAEPAYVVLKKGESYKLNLFIWIRDSEDDDHWIKGCSAVIMDSADYEFSIIDDSNVIEVSKTFVAKEAERTDENKTEETETEKSGSESGSQANNATIIEEKGSSSGQKASTSSSNGSKTENKKNQPINIKVKTKKISKGKKGLTLKKLISVKNAVGTVKYKLTKVNKAKSSFKVDSKTGAIKIKKKLKKGTYKLTITVTAAGTEEYKKYTKKVTVKIKVKK